MKRLNRSALLVFASASLLGCSTSEGAREPGSGARAFLGEFAVSLLKSAERAESFRVQRELGAQPKNEESIAGLRLLARGPELDSAQRELLKRLLFDDGSYELEMAKGCEPMPGVLLRVWRGESYLDLALCFECKMWGIGVVSERQVFPEHWDWEDFDPVNAPLVALVKELFPADAVIQGLR
ncbi:MAG: hypothetical protein IPN34_20585 [Planctomycetes bacterium]|nr:hypothetical protein [Planctomycetota bacterium]